MMSECEQAGGINVSARETHHKPNAKEPQRIAPAWELLQLESVASMETLLQSLAQPPRKGHALSK